MENKTAHLIKFLDKLFILLYNYKVKKIYAVKTERKNKNAS